MKTTLHPDGTPREPRAFSDQPTLTSDDAARSTIDKPPADETDKSCLCYTASDVATLLGLSIHRVYELARRGMIPSVRIGRQVRFLKDAIANWLASGGTADDSAA